MDDVSAVQVYKTLKSHVETVLAELFRVSNLELLKHWCKASSVHELHKDPKTVLEVKGLMALDEGIRLSHLHDSNLVLNCLPLSVTPSLHKL